MEKRAKSNKEKEEENEATEEDGFVNEAPKGVGAIIKSAGRTTDNFLR